MRNEERQLGVVLVNVPLELMYRPRLSMIAICTSAMLVSSWPRPLTRMRDSVNAVPSVGSCKDGSSVGVASPGNTMYSAVAAVVERSSWPAVSTAAAVTV